MEISFDPNKREKTLNERGLDLRQRRYLQGERTTVSIVVSTMAKLEPSRLAICGEE
jgi:uncharacterized DUF497 family protein